MLKQNIKNNLKSGLTVALISIPLSVSLAVSSGTSPTVGIITAIWAGLIAAIFGGSHFNIVGPTGALSGIVATYALVHGASSLPMLTLITGIIIIVAYIVKLERYLILIPSSVIHGFTLGVAFIIGLGQLNFILGLQNIPQHESFFANVFESVKHFNSISWVEFSIFILFLISLLIFKKIAPKLPGAIVLAPLGIVLGYLSEIHIIPFSLQTLGSKFSDISFHFFELPHFTFDISMLNTGAVVALIAILETLLSAKIADGITRTKHNHRKEVLGLGLANIVSGLVGGIPATAALARTSLNIKTGATHRTSAIINALSVAMISSFLLGYFKYIPLSVIGAILVFVAIQMVEKEHYNKLWHYERSGFFIALFVSCVTVIVDTIFGILLGVAISLLVFIDRISRGYFEIKANKIDKGIIDYDSGVKLKELKEDAEVLLYSFQGKLCYINSRAHVERFETNLIKYKYIILRLREVHFIDTDGVEALDEIIDIIEARGQRVLLSGANPNSINLLRQLSQGYKRLKEQGLVFEKSEQALNFLGVPTRPKK
jgi:SulP family sulfate permease